MSRGQWPPLGLAVAASLLAGVLLVQLWPRLPPLWIAPLPALAGLWLLRHGDVRRLLGAFLLGLGLACAHGQWSLQQQLPPALSGKDLWLQGEVLGLPVAEPEATRFEFRVLQGEGQGAGLVGRKLRLSWYRPAAAIAPGSQWRLQVRLRPPRGMLNPGGYDFERRALEQRIAATGYVRDPQSAAQLRQASGIDALRDRLSRRIADPLPGERGRFVRALALGDTRGLSQRDWEILRATGLTHLIAISGFHVGMIAGWAALLMGLLYRLWPALGRHWPRPQGAALAALLTATGYTALAGFALPTVRTLLMIAAVLLARLLRRPQRLGDALALALIVVLLIDPLSVLTPGFWLSFLGVAWLMWCLPDARESGWLRSFLQAQGVAMLGLLPLTVWFFSQASLAGLLVNLVGIPWISLGVVPLAVLGLAASTFSSALADGLWRLSAGLMDMLWGALETIAAWPLSLLWLPEPTLPALLLALIGAFWLLLPRGVPGKPLAAVLLLPLLWPAQDRPGHGEADLVMLDVGQGSSLLVRTRSHALLFDAGPATPGGMDMGESAVLPALRALGIRRLDALLLSHDHNDHAGGAGAVRRAFPMATTFAPEGWALAGASLCQRDQAWEWDGVRFRLLHPPPDYPYLGNDSSCVLRIESYGASALLPGDIGRHVETRLVKEQPASLPADVLVVPHHGSPTSSSAAFIAAVSPRYALFGVGSDNRFRLPRPEVVERYRLAGSQLLDSAGSGAVRIRLGTGGAELRERYRFDRPRYWRKADEMPGGREEERPIDAARAMLSPPR